jgi:hypothetical protein
VSAIVVAPDALNSPRVVEISSAHCKIALSLKMQLVMFDGKAYTLYLRITHFVARYVDEILLLPLELDSLFHLSLLKPF